MQFYDRMSHFKLKLPIFIKLLYISPLFCGIIIGSIVTSFIFILLQPTVYIDNANISKYAAVQYENYSYLTDNESETDIIHDMLNKTIAHMLYDKVNVLCWVSTSPKNHLTRAQHIKATWGRRCNTLIFISTAEDDDLPTVAFPVGDGTDFQWIKTRLALEYLYNFYYDQADWFFKVDDETYAIIENLRYMLYSKNPNSPVYFGCKFKPYVSQGYMSGGAGYVLSKAALRKFATEALPNKSICRFQSSSEDVELGRCLQAVGVRAGGSRDSEGRIRFMPLNIKHLLNRGTIPSDSWIWKYLYYPLNEGVSCCSDVAITIHFVKKEELYLYEYFLYHLKPFGIGFEPKLPEKGSFLDP